METLLCSYGKLKEQQGSQMSLVVLSHLREFTHHIRYLNNSSRKCTTSEAIVNAVPWWKLLGEEPWQGVRAPLGELTYNQCSNRLKDAKLLHTSPYFVCGYTAQVPSAVSGTVLGKSIGADSTSPLNSLKRSTQHPR